jgi:capsule polysaccharide export protein KpsE/RkpR
MLSSGISATFTLFIIIYTATIINVLFAFTAFTSSQFTSNSLIVINQEKEKEEFNNPLISSTSVVICTTLYWFGPI